MTGCAWLWMYAGAALMLLELATSGFVVFFFGLSAATVGIIRFSLGDAFGAVGQLTAFSAFSVAYILVLRRWLKGVFTGDSDASSADFANDYVGRAGKVTVAIAPPLSGRVVIGDAEWTAEADAPVPAGADVRVVAQRNLTMKVEEVK